MKTLLLDYYHINESRMNHYDKRHRMESVPDNGFEFAADERCTIYTRDRLP